jgi:uncharacterized protein YdiU (UPF0061 family)
VYRERPLPGAVLTRVAASHIRVGTFQYFAARRDHDRVRQLADYAIARHDAALAGRYLDWFGAVAERQARLIARWMSVGFIHGVMNTDNMALSGETIDYGPCAFLEAYDPAAVFSSIDHQGRYAFGNQPAIANWNLARLAECIVPLVDEDTEAGVAAVNEVLKAFPERFRHHWIEAHRAKLGLTEAAAGDAELAEQFLELQREARADFTLAWRGLADEAALRRLIPGAGLEAWLERWKARGPSMDLIRATNPWIIARNHRVEEALAAASDANDVGPLEALLAALRRPFDEDPAHARWAEPATEAQRSGYRTFCGT